jgi:hypothetical protein
MDSRELDRAWLSSAAGVMTHRCRRHIWKVTGFDLAAMVVRYRCAFCSKAKSARATHRKIFHESKAA